MLRPIEEDVGGIDPLLVASVTLEFIKCCYQANLSQSKQVCELLLRQLGQQQQQQQQPQQDESNAAQLVGQNFHIFQLMHHKGLPEAHATSVLRELALYVTC